VAGNELTLQMPSGTIAINPIVGVGSGIETLQSSASTQQPSAIYDLLGNRVKTPQTGRIYICNGKKVMWK
jgi:hypothetical protein